MALLIDKHAKYFQLCLNSLPSKAESEDSNKLALIYFSVYGLSLIGKLKLTSDTSHHIEQIYSHMIPYQDREMQAFRSSGTFALAKDNNEYDLPNLSATLFALSILLAFREDYSKRIDRHKIMAFVSRCQIQQGPNKGSFSPVLGLAGQPFGESDLRQCYIAVSIRKMVGYDKLDEDKRKHDIDVELMKSFILQRVNFNGGLASYEYNESHSGLTFCGIAALKLVGHKFVDNDEWTELTVNWLVHRQVDYPDNLYGEECEYEYYDKEDNGSFNGRENKLGDTCYSWWVLASLSLISPENLRLIDGRQAVNYLLEKTQHRVVGGFGKDSSAFPDPFHSFLALASLSLIKYKWTELEYDGVGELCAIDPELTITSSSREFLESIWNA